MRSRALLGLVPLLALALAGCLGGGQPVQPLALAPVRFLDDLAMPGDPVGGEPNLAVLGDGTLFIAAPGPGSQEPNMVHGASWLWRSKDGGATWDTLRGPRDVVPLELPTPFFSDGRAFFSGDADTATSPDGWVYYTDWWFAPPYVVGANFNVEASGDGGETWQSAPITTLDGLTGVDRQWLVGGPEGRVWLVYAYYHPAANTVSDLLNVYPRGDYTMSIQMVRSRDHGATWSEPISVVGPQHGHEVLHGKPFLLPGGELAMPYIDTSNDYLTDPGLVRVALSRDNGTTWAHRTVAEVREQSESVWPVEGAVDDAGNVYVVWSARVGENLSLLLASTPDLGATWRGPWPVSADGLHALPWVAARGDGEVAVGWYGADARGDPQQVEESTAWWPLAATSKDGGRTWSLGKASTEPVKTGPFCPLGARCRDNRELLDYVSVAYDPAGRLHYAFAKSEGEGQDKVGLIRYAGSP